MNRTASPLLSCSAENSFNFGILSPSSPVRPPNVLARFFTALSMVMPVADDSWTDASMTSRIWASVMPREARYACWEMMASSPITERDCISDACSRSLFWISARPSRAVISRLSACTCVSIFEREMAPSAVRGAVSLRDRDLPMDERRLSRLPRLFPTDSTFCWNSCESAPIFMSRFAILRLISRSSNPYGLWLSKSSQPASTSSMSAATPFSIFEMAATTGTIVLRSPMSSGSSSPSPESLHTKRA